MLAVVYRAGVRGMNNKSNEFVGMYITRMIKRPGVDKL